VIHIELVTHAGRRSIGTCPFAVVPGYVSYHLFRMSVIRNDML